MQSHDNREPNERFTLIQNLAEKIKTAEDPQKVLSRWVGQAGNHARLILGRVAINQANRTNITTEEPSRTTIAQRLRNAFTMERLRTAFEIIGIVGALVSVYFLYDQNVAIREQVNQQQQLYTDTRRAELLETIYGRRDCEAESIEACPFVSSIRVRAEAALSFVQIEQEQPERADLTRADLSGADLYNADLSGATLRWADLSNADLFRADLSNADLSNADLSRAILWNADLSGAFQTDADLSGADLYNADLSGATLHDADLSGADLYNADLSGAYLYDADLSGANLRWARYNDLTKWPDGFDPIAAGAKLVEE